MGDKSGQFKILMGRRSSSLPAEGDLPTCDDLDPVQTPLLCRLARWGARSTAHSTSLMRGQGRNDREDPVCGEGDRVERILQRALLALVASFAVMVLIVRSCWSPVWRMCCDLCVTYVLCMCSWYVAHVLSVSMSLRKNDKYGGVGS